MAVFINDLFILVFIMSDLSTIKPHSTPLLLPCPPKAPALDLNLSCLRVGGIVWRNAEIVCFSFLCLALRLLQANSDFLIRLLQLEPSIPLKTSFQVPKEIQSTTEVILA